ncbi:MAG: dethiobiotin synthetase [Actinomycetes bacterium]
MSGRIVVVTGTDTGVGKTIVAAGITTLAHRSGKSVAVVKPCQTGCTGDDCGDVDDVKRLTGVKDLHELARYPEAIGPAAACRLSGLPPLDMQDVATRVRELATNHDIVVVEGAGGFLVEYNEDRQTIADLAQIVGAEIVVVIVPGLGTLNHTALTTEAIKNRNLNLIGVVIGRWSSHPNMADLCNLVDLEKIIGGPIAGAIRSHAGDLSRPEFLTAADEGLAPALGGQFNAGDFRERFDYRRNLDH